MQAADTPPQAIAHLLSPEERIAPAPGEVVGVDEGSGLWVAGRGESQVIVYGGHVMCAELVATDPRVCVIDVSDSYHVCRNVSRNSE